MRHELIGLPCEVIVSQNTSQIGIRGKIVDETMKMIIIKDTEKKSIQKNGSVFRIDLGKQKVDINGNYMITRPEDRIKKKFKKW
jgi:ribonuclease P protein subunit POP4